MTLKFVKRLCACVMLLTTVLGANAASAADLMEAEQWSAQPAIEKDRSYTLGAGRYALDSKTKVTGWRIAQGVYFGKAKAKGEISGLAIVWQRRQDQQMSLSSRGLRFTKRF
jgi:hypothetical protein